MRNLIFRNAAIRTSLYYWTKVLVWHDYVLIKYRRMPNNRQPGSMKTLACLGEKWHEIVSRKRLNKKRL